MRYLYLGDKLTDPALVGQPCDPVRRADGKCIVSQRMATQLVTFADGSRRCVLRRRLRVVKWQCSCGVSWCDVAYCAMCGDKRPQESAS